MISQEKAQAYLSPFIIEPHQPEDFAGFSPGYRALGERIAPLHHYYSEDEVADQEAAAKILSEFFEKQKGNNLWSTPEGKRLAQLLFGPLHAHRIPSIWASLARLPFQSGYHRRPFRTREEDPQLYIQHLKNLYHAFNAGFRGLSLKDIARYCGYFPWQATNLALLFNEALHDNSERQEFRHLFIDILQGEDEIGTINGGLLSGLLMSDYREDHELVGQFLLAAQREEGLRQVILESVDFASVDALRYLIDLILEHKLARFSSVVRAVDVWFGFSWEAPKQRTVEQLLHLASGFLTDPDTVNDALKSKDSLEVYTALWSVALTDVDEAVLLTTNLLLGDNRTQKLTALYFLSQTNRQHPHLLEWMEKNFGEDLEIDYWARSNFPSEAKLSNHLYAVCHTYGKTISKAGKTISGTLFSWLNITVKPEYFLQFALRAGTKDHLRMMAADLSTFPALVREELVRRIFVAESLYYNHTAPLSPETLTSVKATPWKRKLIRDAVSDRSASLIFTGLRFLGELELEEEDKSLIHQLLCRKGKELRAALIRIILGQPEETLREMTSQLLIAKNLDQRLAGLEVLSELHNDDLLLTFVLARATVYRERSRITKNEAVFLDKISVDNIRPPGLDTGFGAININNLSPIIVPQLRFGPYEGKPLCEPFINAEKISTTLASLAELIRQNGKYEYQAVYTKEYKELTLLENGITFLDERAFTASGRERLSYLPLANVWLNWYDNCGLNEFELLYLNVVLDYNTTKATGPFTDFYHQYFPEISFSQLPPQFNDYSGLRTGTHNLVSELYAQLADHQTMASFVNDLLEDMIVRLPDNLREPFLAKDEYQYEQRVFWAGKLCHILPGWSLYNDKFKGLDTTTIKRRWDLLTYLLAACRAYPEAPRKQSLQTLHKDIPLSQRPSSVLTLQLFAQQKITHDDLLFSALQNPQLFQFVAGNRNLLNLPVLKEIDLPEIDFNTLRSQLLNLELDRGELATDASAFVMRLPVIFGTEHLFRTLERMGKETLNRGYSYTAEITRKDSFSHIVKICHPEETATVEAFSEQARKIRLPRARWFEVAMYAPQWAPWIAEFLKVENLEIAVWWFHAHASDYMSPLKEKIVAQFSPVNKEDFRQGAIDVDWFYAAYSGVGKKNWKLLHDAAKYISDGNGHLQVKTYSAVMLGEIKIRETLKKIKERRDKVYVKALGLIPFSKANPEKDALNRYLLLQNFAHEARQYGTQRRESEQLAARIALDNLARNAGYSDPIRFSWIMEAETTNAIMRQSLVTLDNVAVQLFVDHDGKADLRITKNGTPQKTIPAKYRKHKDILALKEHKKTLRQQYSRTRKSLETAMLNEVVFVRDDLRKINLHPIVRPLLAQLVLHAPEHAASGFWRNDELYGPNGIQHQLPADAKFVIAHPSHLFHSVEWDLYQRYAFEQQLVQPFKQIFRELYLVTANEREPGHESLRYQGHQIQPNKAATLLRGRGWTVSESEGLQKVYHQQDVVATMYAMANWFSPSEVEAPVVESIIFRKRNGDLIPITKVPPVLFSEIMRDVDLVVSIAHVGGVDPEASHSTLEMRAALARESARLFGLDNVEVGKRHIVISGELGRYNVHLGSGIVSKDGLQLSIIPVHSQHRGRMFLPFLDDDPKSAEIISKMRMLARDGEIKDPTVLGQILG